MAGRAYITVTNSIGGWKALLVETVYTEHGGSYEEPWQTGIGAYATREEAEAEAQDWAAEEKLEFKP